MRVLLDECLPRRLASELLAHDVVTVPDMGWAGKSNSGDYGVPSGKLCGVAPMELTV